MLKGVRCVRGMAVPMAEHQRCMVSQAGPPCGIEPSILEMITRPNGERAGITFSPSSLSTCQRQRVLHRDTEWFLDVQQGYKMVRGSIIHDGMSLQPAYPGVLGVIREKRMKAPINTRYGARDFWGKFDLLVLLYRETIPAHAVGEMGEDYVPEQSTLHVKLVDYKTRSEIGHDLVRADDKHVDQVNQYAWLAAQFLPGWLNLRHTPEHADFPGWQDYQEHLFLNEGTTLPPIDAIVVDEVSIVYMDMKKPRTFSSKGWLSAEGKMLGDRVNGRWVRRNPVEHEPLELEPIHLFRPKFTESKIRHGIEAQIESETLMAPPLEGDDAQLMCRNCAVKEACYTIGKKEGYSMADQEPFIEKGSKQ